MTKKSGSGRQHHSALDKSLGESAGKNTQEHVLQGDLSPDPGGASGKRILLPMEEVQEIPIRSLGWEDPLKKDMATHSSILAWEIPWTEEPGGLQSMGLQRVRHD